MGSARNAFIALALLSLPLAVHAQTPADAITGNAAPTTSATGTPGIEMIPLKVLDAPIRLRFRGIYPHSDTVTLDGQALARGTDYNIDYISGVLYLMKQANVGQVLRLNYQYDASSQPAAIIHGPSGAQVAPPKQFAPEIGSAPHLDFANTKLLTFSTGLNFGGISSSGLLMITPHATPGSQAANFTGALDQGSQFLVQNFSTKFSHGTVNLDFQDISRNFTGFNLARAAGMDSNVVDQLQKEAGLRRMGFSMDDVTLGPLKISNSFRTVKDDGGSISWKSLGLQAGGLSLTYSARKVDSGFSRFADLSEKDHDQLMKEAGLDRQNLGAEYKAKGSDLSFMSSMIKDEFGGTINRDALDFSAKSWKLDLGQQSVSSNFARMDSLTDPEKALFGRENGLNRKWLNFQTDPLGKGGQPVIVALQNVSSPTGVFRSEDVSLGGKNWSASFAERKMDQGFGLQANLADSEVDKNVQSIGKMYQASGVPTGPGDRAAFLQGADVDRSAFRFTLQPKKDWNLDLEQVTLRGSLDYASLQSFLFNTKNMDLTLRREHEGINFTEAPQLFGFEQQRLGNVPGLDMTNLAFNWRLGGFKKLSMTMMDSSSPNGGAQRDTFAYSDKKIDVSYASRNVDPHFSNANSLTDPENNLLASLMGFRETDFHMKWNLLPKMTMETLWADEKNDTTNADAFQHNFLLSWDPNKNTHLAYTMLDTKSDSALETLYRSRISQFLLSENLGKYGKLQYVHENDTAVDPNGNPAPATVGQQAPPPDPNLPQGDSSKDYFSYEAQLDKKTSIKTEQTLTRFSDGSKEDVSANTINRALTDHVGVSYTDLRIDRPGVDKDETKHNYGVWFDIAKGVRLSYGFVRDNNQIQGNTANSTIGLTPGNVGLLHVDALGLNTNSWDQLHNQVATNVQLKSSKPLSMGFLKNIQFNLGMDTSSDYSAWQRDNKLFNLSGNVGSNSFMVEYKSQLDSITNEHGIDRFVKFETDQSDKRWLKASVKLKQRVIPGQGTTTIRDYSITMRPLKNLEITNQVLTNPEEQFRPDALLGSITSPWRVNKYKLDYHSGQSTSIGATWEDRINDITRDFYRTAGVDMELFKNSGSPLTFWYGMEQGGGSTPRQTAARYYLKFYQKPGPNQVFNIFAGNISYDYTKDSGFSKNNWTLHLDYEYRFW